MGCVGEGLVLDDSTMMRLLGVVDNSRRLGGRAKVRELPERLSHSRTQTRGD